MWVYVILVADHLFLRVKPERMFQAETMGEIDHFFG